METQCQQRLQVVLPGAAPLAAAHSRQRDRPQCGHNINLDHAAVGHKENTDRQDVHGQTHHKGLEPQAEQTANGHAFQLKFQSGYQAVKVDGCFTDDNAGTLVDNALGGIEHTHNDVPCIADNEDGKGRLENPAEEHGGVEVVHIVLFGNHLDKLMAHHKGKDSRCNGQHHRFGKTAKHIENAAVPCLRGGANVRSDFAHLGVHVVEQAGEVARDAIYQNAFYPFLDDLTNQAKIPPFPRPPGSVGERGVGF